MTFVNFSTLTLFMDPVGLLSTHDENWNLFKYFGTRSFDSKNKKRRLKNREILIYAIHLLNSILRNIVGCLCVLYFSSMLWTTWLSDRAGGERLGESNVWKTKGGVAPSITNIYSLHKTLYSPLLVHHSADMVLLFLFLLSRGKGHSRINDNMGVPSHL